MADADLASGQPCVPDHGEQGPQSLAQELLRGVSEPLPHCESVWGRGGGGGVSQQILPYIVIRVCVCPQHLQPLYRHQRTRFPQRRRILALHVSQTNPEVFSCCLLLPLEV